LKKGTVTLKKIFEISEESNEETDSARKAKSDKDQPYYLPLFRLQNCHPFFRKFSIEAVSAILQLGRIIMLRPN
jgi:hypothetical protein